mmetsp:Transcript_463/g.1747  ORF Transcript_463/g.1747 Transcript_463/m.1747 type:complete len:505 (-) Transcript_463:1147-2661(-)
MSAAKWSGPVSVWSPPARRPETRLTLALAIAAVPTASQPSTAVNISDARDRIAPIASLFATSHCLASALIMANDDRGRSRSELMATMSVAPSCMSTAPHSGTKPLSAGKAAPAMDTAASTRFCFRMAFMRLDSCTRLGRTEASERNRTMSAAAADASDGVCDTAMPTSAAASAGASLMPSPTITQTPLARASSTRASLSSGSSPACTCDSGIPTVAPTATAFSRLSPVTIATSQLSPPHAASLSFETASRLDARTVSAKYIIVTSSITSVPATSCCPPLLLLPPTLARIAMVTCVESTCAASRRMPAALSAFTHFAATWSREPSTTLISSEGSPSPTSTAVPSTPRPCTCLKEPSCTRGSRVPLLLLAACALAWQCTTARAMGWLAACSNASATASARLSALVDGWKSSLFSNMSASTPATAPALLSRASASSSLSTPMHTSCPVVRVPVLSMRKVLASASASSVRALWTSTPLRAHLPSATTYTKGAMNSAQGAAAVRKPNAL